MKLEQETPRKVWAEVLKYAVKENMTVALRADLKVECTNLINLLGCLEVENLVVDELVVGVDSLTAQELDFVVLRMTSLKQVGGCVIF